ncbi:MAG: citrate synthase [Pseudomonadales bacterium]|nr:citrate synthase [Pseudomonadales bacterium]
MSDKKAHLEIDGIEGKIELPVYSGTLGPDVVDVRGLTAKGLFTYDPGFVSTAACESSITFIGGAKGILLHRGYPIEQLAEQSDHLETCYLLLFGELPNKAEKEAFISKVNAQRTVDNSIASLVKSFDRGAHPMSILCSATAALAGLYHKSLDITNNEHRVEAAINLIAKMPTLTAMCYRHSQGMDFITPNDDLDYAANFLYMMSGKTPSKTAAHAMDVVFLLHADHEQNASTSTVRLSGSSGTNPYAAIAAGIATLWGPSHGGANEAVLNMLNEIGDVSRIDEYVAKAKDKSDPFRLMGFGHRVYKNFDPRSRVMKKCCDEVLAELGNNNDPLLAMAKKLEVIALEDSYFVEKKLYPNVDFYSGILLKSLGIPVELFTCIFATGRTPGWISHWHEMLSEPYKIGRPRQLYKGAVKRDFVKLEDR